MNDQVWSGITAFVGLVGFWLAGRKVWWSWYVNIFNQIAWVIFALITGYYAFILSAFFYFVVFSRNAYLWTKNHRETMVAANYPTSDEREAVVINFDFDDSQFEDTIKKSRALIDDIKLRDSVRSFGKEES